MLEGQLGLDDALVVPGHPDAFELSPVPAVEPGTVWAVDGGSCTVADGRSFQVAAFRAARVRFAGGGTVAVERPQLEVRAVAPEEMATLARVTLTELCGAEPERLPDLPRPVDALREWAEWGEVARTVREAGAGDLVLVDGSLHGGPLVPQIVVQRVHEEAVYAWRVPGRRGEGVHAVLGTERSPGHAAEAPGRSRGGAVALGCEDLDGSGVRPPVRRRHLRRPSRAHRAARVPRRRRPRARARGPGPRSARGLADDPAFVGYPYPLARAHQAARVTGYDVVDVRRSFREALSRRGMAEDDVELLFQDFHEVLNR